jgi:hypothetical protein
MAETDPITPITESEPEQPFTLTSEAVPHVDRKTYQAAWYQANKERVKARTKAYCEANRERKRQADKAYHEANKETILPRERAKRQADPEKYRARERAYYQANRKACRERMERLRLVTKFGITPEELERLYRSHDDRCGICKTPFMLAMRHIDHCHRSRKVRGLLCNRCNMGMGGLGDNPSSIRNAIMYLAVKRASIVIADGKKKRFGLTSELIDQLWDQQNGRCGICQKNRSELKQSHIDHCHKTMIVRGMLCGNCNRGVGMFNDDPRLLRAAIAYLKKHDQKNDSAND